jgi:hypothetical protein
VTTTVAHSLLVGGTVTLVNFAENVYNNVSVNITAVTSTTFTFTTLSTNPTTGTPVGVAYYTPSIIIDSVIFTVPLLGGEKIDIRSLRGVVVTTAAGEANLLASVGTGVSLSGTKSGVTLNVKSLKAGNNITLTDNGNDVTIVADGKGFEDRITVNSNSTITDPTSYVGVQNSSGATAIDISGIAANGRSIAIKDELGNAGTFNINIDVGVGKTVDGTATPYVISTNYGGVTLVSDGTNWFIKP